MHLVYRGGSRGLMGAVAKATQDNGSRVLGIIPKPLAAENIVGKTIGEELQVLSMHQRMALMIGHSDAFIALPGGIGTLEEIFQITSWAQLKMHQKPIGLLNINGFYDKLLSFLDYAVEKEFVSPLARRILISASTVDELINQLYSFVPISDPALHELDWPPHDSEKKRKIDLTLRL